MSLKICRDQYQYLVLTYRVLIFKVNIESLAELCVHDIQKNCWELRKIMHQHTSTEYSWFNKQNKKNLYAMLVQHSLYCSLNYVLMFIDRITICIVSHSLSVIFISILSQWLQLKSFIFCWIFGWLRLWPYYSLCVAHDLCVIWWQTHYILSSHTPHEASG